MEDCSLHLGKYRWVQNTEHKRGTGSTWEV